MAVPARKLWARAMATGIATLTAEALYAHRRDLPTYPDLDASGSFGDPSLPRVDIVLVGDSTSTGPGLDDPSDIWIGQAGRRLASRYHVTVESHAKGGARARDVLGAQLREALRSPHDVAVVAIGANDALRLGSPVHLEARLRAAVTALLTRCGAVVLCGIGDVGSAARVPFPLSAVVSRACRAADRIHARVAAGHERILKVAMWELTTDAMRRRDDIWSGDLFHPNERGHAIWAEAALPTLERAIEIAVRHRAEGRQADA